MANKEEKKRGKEKTKAEWYLEVAPASQSHVAAQRGRMITDDALRLLRRQAVWELRVQGRTQDQIAAQLNISQATVHRDLRWCIAKAEDEVKGSVLAWQLEQLARYDYIISEAMAAWEESKQEYIEVQQRSLAAKSSAGSGSGPGSAQGKAKASGGKPKQLEVTTRIKEQTGDPSYFQVAMKAMDAQRKILGADAPIKIAHTDAQGRPVPVGQAGLVVILPHNNREPLEQVTGDNTLIGDPEEHGDNGA